MQPLDQDHFHAAPQPQARYQMVAPERAPRGATEGGNSRVSEAVARAIGARRGTPKSTAPRDPAPSRAAYRMSRLWLTPSFRFFMRRVSPILAIAACVALWFSDADHRLAFTDMIAAVQRDVQTRPEFMVKLMAIDGASPELAEEIRAMSHVDFPISSFDLDLAGMMDQIETLDAVSEVGLRVRAGGILQVDITERVPAVVWRSPHGLELLDAEGHRVASISARTDVPTLPLVVGEGADRAIGEAMALLRAGRPLLERTRGLVRVGERRWDFVLDRGQTIMLPEVGAKGALAQIIALDSAQDLLARDLTEIDMRNPARPTLRLTEVAQVELRRIKGLELGVTQ